MLINGGDFVNQKGINSLSQAKIKQIKASSRQVPFR